MKSILGEWEIKYAAEHFPAVISKDDNGLLLWAKDVEFRGLFILLNETSLEGVYGYGEPIAFNRAIGKISLVIEENNQSLIAIPKDRANDDVWRLYRKK